MSLKETNQAIQVEMTQIMAQRDKAQQQLSAKEESLEQKESGLKASKVKIAQLQQAAAAKQAELQASSERVSIVEQERKALRVKFTQHVCPTSYDYFLCFRSQSSSKEKEDAIRRLNARISELQSKSASAEV